MSKKTAAAAKIKYLRVPADLAKHIEQRARKENRSDSQQMVYMLRQQVVA